MWDMGDGMWGIKSRFTYDMKQAVQLRRGKKKKKAMLVIYQNRNVQG